MAPDSVNAIAIAKASVHRHRVAVLELFDHHVERRRHYGLLGLRTVSKLSASQATVDRRLDLQ